MNIISVNIVRIYKILIKLQFQPAKIVGSLYFTEARLTLAAEGPYLQQLSTPGTGNSLQQHQHENSVEMLPEQNGVCQVFPLAR